MPHQDKIALEIENKLTDILRAISADVGINTTVRHALLSLYQQGVEKVLDVLEKDNIAYCKAQNGRPDCKNCGLDVEELRKELLP